MYIISLTSHYDYYLHFKKGKMSGWLVQGHQVWSDPQNTVLAFGIFFLESSL